MKIVIIGGTGLIGSTLVEKLRGDGHHTLAASPGSGGGFEGARVVVDVSDAASIAAASPGSRAIRSAVGTSA